MVTVREVHRLSETNYSPSGYWLSMNYRGRLTHLGNLAPKVDEGYVVFHLHETECTRQCSA